MNKPSRAVLTEQLVVRVSPEERERLDREATELDRSPSWIIRRALRAHLDGVGQSEGVTHA